MLFLTNANSSKCDTFFWCILDWRIRLSGTILVIESGTILMIKGHHQGQNVNVKVK